MDYLLAILNATLCVHATEHSIYRVTQIEFKKIQCHPSKGWMNEWIIYFSDHKHPFLYYFANHRKFKKLCICITN